jgi:hypothetical protein
MDKTLKTYQQFKEEIQKPEFSHGDVVKHRSGKLGIVRGDPKNIAGKHYYTVANHDLGHFTAAQSDLNKARPHKASNDEWRELEHQTIVTGKRLNWAQNPVGKPPGEKPFSLAKHLGIHEELTDYPQDNLPASSDTQPSKGEDLNKKSKKVLDKGLG